MGGNSHEKSYMDHMLAPYIVNKNKIMFELFEHLIFVFFI
jgi:hypothetical protein